MILFCRAMFSADFKEKAMNKIVLKDTPVEAFLTLLRYIYFGKLTLPDYQENDVLETLRLANYFQVEELVKSIVGYLLSTLRVENVCNCLKMSTVLSLSKLESDCLCYIDINAAEFFNHASYLRLHEVCWKGFLLLFMENFLENYFGSLQQVVTLKAVQYV